MYGSGQPYPQAGTPPAGEGRVRQGLCVCIRRITAGGSDLPAYQQVPQLQHVLHAIELQLCTRGGAAKTRGKGLISFGFLDLKRDDVDE